MNIIPVLDILHGQVVRGVAGRRSEYRPIVSRLTNSTEPIEVANAFFEHFGLSEFYVADLDAITDAAIPFDGYDQFSKRGYRLRIDAGNHFDICPGHTVVAGLESVAGPTELSQLVGRLGRKLVFSLDLMAGKPMGRIESWSAADGFGIAQQAIDLGVERILVLDLAGVGVNAGSKTADVCVRLRSAYPTLRIATGGGVRGLDDLMQLKEIGVDEVLIASALHDARLSRTDLACIIS